MSATVLTSYPLSYGFRSELEKRYGSIEILTIAQLRRERVGVLLRRLRHVTGIVVLALEGSSARSTLPALQALAALTRAASIVVDSPGAPSARTTRRAAFGSLASVALGSAKGFAALAAADRTNRQLLRRSRTTVHADLARGVLLLNPSPWAGLNVGGSVTHMVGVANALAAEGTEITVATYGDTRGLHDDVQTHALRLPSGYGLPPEVNRFRFARAAAEISLRPGLVYERASLGSTAGVQISRRLGVPLVVEYNGSELWAARNWGGTTRLEGPAARAENATLEHAHLIVTVSEPLAEELRGRGVDPERIVLHPNGVDPDRFDPHQFSSADRERLRARYGIPHDAVLATFVGTFGYWHGAEVLVRAAQDAPLYVLFVGDGPRASEVRSTLGDNARFAGAIEPDEIPVHLAASDILVAPHIPNPDGTAFFGSPTKVFEYMAAGRAIVASDLGQIGEVLDGAAILVRPGDSSDLRGGLERAAQDPALREELGGRARERVLAHYTWGHHARAILAAIDAI